MISSDIKYSFNQFETALIAFCSNIQLKIQNIIPNIPVYVLNTGDFSYMVDKKFVQTKNEEIYQVSPRVIIKFEDFQLNTQEDTNQYNKIVYLFDDGNGPRNYQAVARRKAYNVQISCIIVSSNLITALNYIEVMTTIGARENVFTYDFLGRTIQSSYTIQQHTQEVPNIDMGQNNNTNVATTFQIELQVQLIVPRVETIKLYDEVGTDKIKYDIESKTTDVSLDKEPEYNQDGTEKPKPIITDKTEIESDMTKEEFAPRVFFHNGKMIPTGISFN